MRKKYHQKKQKPIIKFIKIPVNLSVHQRAVFFRRCGKRRR
jgi:hypothetical protein